MHQRPAFLCALLLGTLWLTSCESVTAPEMPPSFTRLEAGPGDAVGAPAAQATGGGHYAFDLAGETFPGKLSFSALQFGDGRARGQFRFELDFLDGIPEVIDGGVVAIQARVTCLAVDLAQGRAWIGGVVTQNRSTQPDFRDDPTTQVGKDVWFRVLDRGEGPAEADRTTFVGFEGGGGILTSAEYCQARIWPDDNARTHPVTQGNLQVHE